jgi:uncharacterized protein YxjI
MVPETAVSKSIAESIHQYGWSRFCESPRCYSGEDMLLDGLNHDRYLLKRQVLKLVGSSFRIYDPAGQMVMYVHQKGFRLKEDIRVYSDEAKSTELLTIRARQIMDFSAAYDVVDATSGEKVGALKRKGWSSLVRDSWILMDAGDREVGQIEEDQMALALVRRFLTNLVPQSFDINLSGAKVCDLRQRFNPFLYQLEIDLTSDRNRTLDRRMAFASAILLSAIEGRQG